VAFWVSVGALTKKPHPGAGEMVFPWMFDEFAQLRKVKEVAEIVAHDAGVGRSNNGAS
jgi:hypothetical protein